MPSRDNNYESTNITPNLREIMEIEDGVNVPEWSSMSNADLIGYLDAFDFYDAVKPFDLEAVAMSRGLFWKQVRLI